jgi:hypothetical protein
MSLLLVVIYLKLVSLVYSFNYKLPVVPVWLWASVSYL